MIINGLISKAKVYRTGSVFDEPTFYAVIIGDRVYEIELNGEATDCGEPRNYKPFHMKAAERVRDLNGMRYPVLLSIIKLIGE